MFIYDKTSTITWHGGKTSTPEELVVNPARRALVEEDCVLMDNGAGVVYSWRRLADLKMQYGVEEEDPEVALKLIQIEMDKPRPTTNSVHKDNLDSQEAIAELGILVDENALTLEDVLNAIAELGAIVTADE